MKSHFLRGFLFIVLCISIGSVNASIVNGSFETADYTGWTLSESFEDELPIGEVDIDEIGNEDSGTWGIATDGQEIEEGDLTWDFHDEILVKQGSVGLPITYEATDGDYLAYQLQNGPQTHRMYQDITLGVDATTLDWDMAYQNHAGLCEGDICIPEGDVLEDDLLDFQSLSVNIRDLDDEILETLFITDDKEPFEVLEMTAYSADISKYAGKEVRLDIMMLVYAYHFDAAFDNFRVDGRILPSPVPVPAAAWLFGTALIGFVAVARRRKVT
jgi:hypothetical protein